MKLLQRLAYRVKRLFNGPSGIVENIDVASEFPRDRWGSFPQRVTYRTPLGEIITEEAPLILIHSERDLNPFNPVQSENSSCDTRVLAYKIYTFGDRFP